MPQSRGRRRVNPATTAIGTIFQADSPHFSTRPPHGGLDAVVGLPVFLKAPRICRVAQDSTDLLGVIGEKRDARLRLRIARRTRGAKPGVWPIRSARPKSCPSTRPFLHTTLLSRSKSRVERPTTEVRRLMSDVGRPTRRYFSTMTSTRPSE